MKFYPVDYSVEVIVAFTDLNGAAVTPTAVRAALFDGEEDQIKDLGEITFEPTDTQVSIVVPGELNYLDDNEVRAARILRIEIETAAGVIPRSHSYGIEAVRNLVPLTNTFLTMEAAELEVRELVNTAGWMVASDDSKRAALSEAFRRVTSIPMKFAKYRGSLTASSSGWRADWNSILPRELQEEVVIAREDWADITSNTFSDFPVHFRKALRRAQLIEANELLQGDPVGQKHRAGIVTETIGESSVTLRAGRVDYGVSTQTLQALAGYVHFNMRTARA